jgi:hypothetical protein
MGMNSEQGKRWWYSLKYHTVEDDDGPTPGATTRSGTRRARIRAADIRLEA